jgi:hypothetical protein
MTKITESNSSSLLGWIQEQRDLIPSFIQAKNWTPEKGTWYAAEKAGRIGGGWGGAGSGAWLDSGIPVLPGDKFRLVSYGSPACPSLWEVEFTSPLRNLGGKR